MAQVISGGVGIGKDTFDVANRLFKNIRGGLGISTVAANAVFAAVTGISIASAAVFTKVAVPEMIRLMAEVPLPQGWRMEAVLCELAGDGREAALAHRR